MRRRLAMVALLVPVLSPKATDAQRLDIGGIELRLGQDVTEALRALGSYRIVYQEGMKAWFVSQTRNGEDEWLGHFSATQGRVTFISKAFRVVDEYAIGRAYGAAVAEARRRGGPCTTENYVADDGEVHGVVNFCGPYTATYFFAWRRGSELTAPGISITVRAAAPK